MRSAHSLGRSIVFLAAFVLARMAAGEQACSWGPALGEGLLARRVSLQVADAAPVLAAVALREQHQVPVSFIEAAQETRVTLDLRNVTLREALDALAAKAPLYRWRLIEGRPVVYPKEGRYEALLEGLDIPRSPRLQSGNALAKGIAERVPELKDLGGIALIGDPRSFVFQDPVALPPAGTVVDLLAHLPGGRPSVFFQVLKQKWGTPALGLGAVAVLRGVDLPPLRTALRPGEVLRLQLKGMLATGASVDLTGAACGTVYQSSAPEVASVDAEGTVKALAPGRAQVTARNENQWDSIVVEVAAPGRKSKVP